MLFRPSHHRTARATAALLASAGSIAVLATAATGTAAATTAACRAQDGSSGAWSSNLAAVLAAAKPGDTINLRSTCTGNFRITVPLTLQGTFGATLNGGGTGTALTIEVPSGTVTINTVEFTGGAAADGGGIAVDPGATDPLTLNLLYDQILGNTATVAGGGLYTGTIAALNINKSDFNDNTLTAGARGGEGAGLWSTAPVNLSLSNVLGNTVTAPSGATVTGGAVFLTAPSILYGLEVEHTTVTAGQINGAGLTTTGALTLNYSTIFDNTATTTSGSITGAGVDATGPSALIEDTDTVGNVATTGTGAIHGAGIATGAATPLTLSDAGVDANQATSASGSVSGVGVSAAGPATVENSGLYTNQGSSTSGTIVGGGMAASAPVQLSNGLITGNAISSTAGAADGGGIWTDATTDLNTMTVGANSAGTAGGGVYLVGAPLTIEGSRLSGDTALLGAAIDNVGGSVSSTGSLIVGGCVACG